MAVLLGLATLLTCIYAGLARLSFSFVAGTVQVERPLLPMLGLLGFAFGCYVAAIFVALRTRDGKALLSVVVLSSVLFRVVSLYSWPIQEIDIYRYLWDGSVVLEGVSPYRYSPEQVLLGTADGRLPDDLQRLVELRDTNAAVGTILSRIHYDELPTIYPPVSQIVFAAAVSVTPAESDVFQRIVVMKAAFVVFDLATLAVVVLLLRLAGKHTGWSLAYGWCPLVIKEIANSGHLDSLAVFLATLALFFAAKSLVVGTRAGLGRTFALAASLLLALAIGAKLYPIVLAPLFAALWIRGLGWRWAAVAATVFLSATAILVWPMVPTRDVQTPPDVETTVTDETTLLPSALIDVESVKPKDPSAGLVAFLREWEMNDFLFLIVVENLKPVEDAAAGRRPWFPVMPDSWKIALLSAPSRWLETDTSKAAFLMARGLTAAVFVLIVASLLWQVRSSRHPAAWLRVAFLTLAWFWLLSPTQNSWYWLWALPLVMFAPARAWLAVSGLTMIYYFRFWLSYHHPDDPVLGTPYSGTQFFDFVVTCLEFGPWFVWLAWESVFMKSTGTDDPIQPPTP